MKGVKEQMKMNRLEERRRLLEESRGEERLMLSEYLEEASWLTWLRIFTIYKSYLPWHMPW